MAYTNVWDDSKPTGSEAANTIDDIFRSVKVDLEQRFIDLFNMANFTADPLRPGGLKFYDTADAKLFFGDNAGTPRGILLRNKADSLTYAQWLYTGITLSPPALTVGSTPFLNVTQTWNNVATTFVGILVNITNTNSSVNSLFFDYQVGSVSQWKVSRAGVGTLTGILTAGGFVGGLTGSVIGTTISASTSLAIASTTKLYLDGVAASGDSYIWESSANNIIHVVGGVNNLTLTSTTALFGSIAVSGISTLAGTGAVSGFTTSNWGGKITAGAGILVSSGTIQLGGTTASQAAISYSGTEVRAVLGDSSAYAPFHAASLTIETGGITVTAGTTAVQALTATNASITHTADPALTITSDASLANRHIRFTNSQASGKSWDIEQDNVGNGSGIRFKNQTDAVSALILSPTGAGTFAAGISCTTGTFSSDTSIAATKKLFVDGGGDTYLIETSANVLDIFAGGSQIMRLAPTSFSFYGHTTVSQQTISGSRGGNAALASLLTALAATGIVVDGTSA